MEREHTGRAAGREDSESSRREESHITESIKGPMVRWGIGVCMSPSSPRGWQPSPSIRESHRTPPTTMGACGQARMMEHLHSALISPALPACLSHPHHFEEQEWTPKISHHLPMALGWAGGLKWPGLPHTCGYQSLFPAVPSWTPRMGRRPQLYSIHQHLPLENWLYGDPQTGGGFGRVVLPSLLKAQRNEGTTQRKAWRHKGLN